MSQSPSKTWQLLLPPPPQTIRHGGSRTCQHLRETSDTVSGWALHPRLVFLVEWPHRVLSSAFGDGELTTFPGTPPQKKTAELNMAVQQAIGRAVPKVSPTAALPTNHYDLRRKGFIYELHLKMIPTKIVDILNHILG